MEFVFGLAIMALLLAVVNVILIISRVIQKRLAVWMALVIVIAAIIVPYGLALVTNIGSHGMSGLDRALSTWVWSGFVLMLIILFYLSNLKVKELHKKKNPELLDD